MDGNEITSFFSKISLIKPHFMGIFSIDTIPKKIKEKSFFICNLSKLKDPGSHWVAFVKSSKNTLEIFDSLSCNIEYILPFLPFKQKYTLLYNESRFQPEESISCGKFVIYFCFHRLVNLDLNFKLLLESIFSSEKQVNESKVTDFYYEVLNDTLYA